MQFVARTSSSANVAPTSSSALVKRTSSSAREECSADVFVRSRNCEAHPRISNVKTLTSGRRRPRYNFYMSKHESKSCPRCQRLFECRAGDITNCQCYGIKLTTEEKMFIEERFQDCLCGTCLSELKNKYILFKERLFWK